MPCNFAAMLPVPEFITKRDNMHDGTLSRLVAIESALAASQHDVHLDSP
jgi:hypothetical protein